MSSLRKAGCTITNAALVRVASAGRAPLSHAAPTATAVTQRSHSSTPTSGRRSSRTYISPFADWFDSIQRNETYLYGETESKKRPVTYTKSGVPEHKIKFKTASFGRLVKEPFIEHNEHKVTLQVRGEDLPFDNDIQRQAFQEIVGGRYNPEKDILKLSSVQFGSRIENKRYVVHMLDRIVDATKHLSDKVQKEIDNANLTSA